MKPKQANKHPSEEIQSAYFTALADWAVYSCRYGTAYVTSEELFGKLIQQIRADNPHKTILTSLYL